MSLFTLFKLNVDSGDDSSLSEPFAHGAAIVSQVLDQKCFSNKYLVAPGAAETQIVFSSTLTTGYRWAVLYDYPILIRANGVSATQHTGVSGNVAATNLNSPKPYMGWLGGTTLLTSLYLAPITGAASTANVKVLIFGDPTSAYV